MMSSLQNRAGSLFKNIKDTSRQVVNTVQVIKYHEISMKKVDVEQKSTLRNFGQ